MPLWGNSTSDESRPKWLIAGDYPANNLNECFADERGWVLRHKDGTEEVLVAIGGLAGAGTTDVGLGNATIVKVHFTSPTLGTSTYGTFVEVQYNEKVDVKNLGATLVVDGYVSGAGAFVGYAITVNGDNKVGFAFTTAASAETLTIPGQTIVGLITDTSTAVASYLVFTSVEVAGSNVEGTGITTTTAVG